MQGPKELRVVVLLPLFLLLCGAFISLAICLPYKFIPGLKDAFVSSCFKLGDFL